eukprot:5919478-Pleurochrysis_carterae.AAC.1
MEATHRVMPDAVCRLIWAAQACKRAATAARPGSPWPTWPATIFLSCTNKARSWSNLTGGTLKIQGASRHQWLGGCVRQRSPPS